MELRRREEHIRAAVALAREAAQLDDRRRRALERLAGAYLGRACMLDHAAAS
jgi:hypothetical protein